MLRRVRRVLWGIAALAAIGLAILKFTETDDGGRVIAANNASFKAKFDLFDHNGELRTENDFKGKWLLVFFGYANCPDVCPTTLAEVAAVIQSIGDRASDVQPLFISIDPGRDTPKALSEFVPAFDAGIVGLTGSPEQIAETTANFYIFYEQTADESTPDGYTMGHSSQLFLFGPDSEFVLSWSYGTAAETLIGDLLEAMKS
ncbi:MAG: SCO family protein [Pikeienuella sp.]